ncbi:hypothetical protein H2248_005762 [Termitomyces sp. 'cryptogamus']|nr:hypothetical protein H2248_005762 [Termitomyces sp. 'cryptogamus']
MVSSKSRDGPEILVRVSARPLFAQFFRVQNLGSDESRGIYRHIFLRGNRPSKGRAQVLSRHKKHCYVSLMSWIYSTIARTARRSLLHSSHPWTRQLLQCSALFAATKGSINHLQLYYEQIHASKSRRIDFHNWPHLESARFLNARPLVQIASGLASGVSSRKEFLRYHLSATRSASTLATESAHPFDVSTTLMPAQTSPAHRAVNLSLQTQVVGSHDALHIVNSLLLPTIERDPDAANFLNVTSYPAITFNRPVSPRLVSHSLVHGLIREKRLKDASTLALAMMRVGMPVHTQTLSVLMESLKPPKPVQKNVFKAKLPRNFRPNPKRVDDLVGMAEHTSTRLALELFTVARRTGQKNMRGLLSTLIAICVINTELVIACLAFAMLIKEYSHPPPSPERDTTKSTWNTERYGPRSLLFLPQWPHLIDLTTPLKDYFRYLTTLHTGSLGFDQDTLDANLQALAILANLLDVRKLHLEMISALLSLMYNTPRITSQVWVLDKAGNARREVAYQYFHDVLVRLIESPPPSGKRSRASTPPFCLETCNTLIHYALRHCHSQLLANKVLVYLTQERKLKPDEVTYNILLRSGTLLREDGLASLALSAITHPEEDRKQHRPKSEPNLSIISPLGALTHSKSEVARRIASVIKTIHSIHLEPSETRTDKLKHALYILTTLIMHLCSKGHPHYVKAIIFALFPILHRRPSSFKEYVMQRRKAIRLATRFGYLPFSVMLNSLVKAQAFREARLLYSFAVAVERRSFFTSEPWTLGIEIYTIMLKACEGECRHATKLESMPAAVADGRPAEVRLKAVRLALRLYRRLNKLPYFAYNLMRRFGHLRNVHKLVFPKPDERFAGALIKVLLILSKQIDPTTVAIPDIFLKHRKPRSRIQAKISASAVSETYAKAQKELREDGKLPEGYTQQLQFIARGIINAGMEVPPALRHLFLGRDKKAAGMSNEEKVSLKVVPWAYPAEPKKGAWHAWTVPNIRTRGLLLNRMTRAQRARFSRERRAV